MNINSSSYWSASSASSNGLSGLVSGLDTESMVKQMLSNTQKKIDAQKGLRQTTTWRQEMYRDIIDSINTFRNKYFNTAFDASSNMNFASEAFFNTMKAELKSGSGVRVIGADSTAIPGDMRVKIEQLATAAKVEAQADHKISTNKVTGEAIKVEDLKKSFEKTMKIKVKTSDGSSGTQEVEVDVDLKDAKTQDDVINTINEAFKKKGLEEKVKVEKDGLALKFTVQNGTSISDLGQSYLAAKVTGLSSPKTIKDDKTGDVTIIGNEKVDAKAAFSFDVSLDGVSKNISLDNITDPSSLTLDELSKKINEKLKVAFGEGVLETKVENGNQITFGFADTYDVKGHSFRLTGVDLNKLGIVPGTSSHIDHNTKLGDLPGVTGGLFEFKINGQEFSFDKNATVGQMLQEINASSAGVKITYSTLADQFIMESASTGANYKIEVEQTNGNLLTAMFGDQVVNAGAKATTEKLTTNKVEGTALEQAAKIKEASLTFTVNGKTYQFSLPRKPLDKDKQPQYYTKEEFETEFNKYLKSNFGEDIVYNKDTGSIDVKKAGYEVSVTSESVSGKVNGEGNDAKIDLGLAGKNNIATKDTKVEDVLNFSDQDKSQLGKSNKLSDLNGGLTFKDGRLEVTGEEAATKLPDLMKDAKFGNGALTATVVSGTDAKVTINGVETTRSSNTFTVDGVTIELTGTHKEGEEAVIGTSRDIDTIIAGFESFVKDYNEMLDKLYGYTDANPEFRKYPPLTAEQKKEMSDREIELWEEKAKTGLLRRDGDVEHFLSQMRTQIYERPAGAKFALYDIGIETGTYSSKGKLTLDTNKLRNALVQDPASVEQLFLDLEDGLSKKLSDTMKKAANTSSGSPGTLVALAGAKGFGTEGNNELTRKLKDIDERIKSLEAKYEKEKQRYWNQFNRMEQILANFNAQSGMIQSQFMGMGY